MPTSLACTDNLLADPPLCDDFQNALDVLKKGGGVPEKHQFHQYLVKNSHSLGSSIKSLKEENR